LNHTIDPVNPQLDPTVIHNSTAKLRHRNLWHINQSFIQRLIRSNADMQSLVFHYWNIKTSIQNTLHHRTLLYMHFMHNLLQVTMTCASKIKNRKYMFIINMLNILNNKSPTSTSKPK
jgi:hypothetical protein